MTLEILQRNNLPLGGFAGLTEHRLVTDPRVFGADANSGGSWPGIGNFVYLADAYFEPHGDTHMHSHSEVDVISVMVEGRIAHEGSLQHGQSLVRNDVQVQRAGGEGFSHNEVNPDDEKNRMIQIWVLPETPGEPAGYKHYQPVQGKLVSVYGSHSDGAVKQDTFAARTNINVALLSPSQSVNLDQPFIAYLVRGTGQANGVSVKEGDLFRASSLLFVAEEVVAKEAVAKEAEVNEEVFLIMMYESN